MPPHSTTNILQALGQSSFDTTFLHQQEESTIRLGDLRKAQLATPEWNNTLLYSLSDSLGSFTKPALTPRLNVKTHVFKKELQEYVPTQIEDRLRIETIIYVELSILDENSNLVNAYDYARLPKELFFTQPDKVMSPEEMGTKRIIDISTTLQCPSNNWQEEKEACLRCARRMSTKMDQTESRIMHMLPELHRTESGDALISFRSGVANIQFKINCYCGHKKEKEGFVIRFDSKSDATIASHVTLPLMFYHQNKNRVASRAAKAQAKDQQQQQQEQPSNVRNIVKSVTSKSKRESRSHSGSSPIGIGNQQNQIPSPPNSLLDSPIDMTSSPELDDIMDSTDIPFAVPSPPPPDLMISLFPESTTQEQQQPTIALISHMTPDSGPVRGGTMVTIHGSGFTVGEVMYVCFGENIVPVIPRRDHMLECITPGSTKAGTVAVFAMNAIESTIPQATFTYVDDNEKELIKLALQRLMNISTRVEAPMENVVNRANEFALWNDLLQGEDSSSASSLGSSSYSNLEELVINSFKMHDTPSSKNIEGLSIVNSTGHTMLHLAVSLQYESLAKDLLLRNVDVSVKDKNGLTALDWARRLNYHNMVDLISTSTISLPVTSAFVGGKVSFTACSVVAQGFESSVSPGSHPASTDQPNLPHGNGGIACHEPIQLDQVPGIDLDAHMDPQLIVEWEGFGQGPGKDIDIQAGVVDGLFGMQHEETFFLQQARKEPPGLQGEIVDQDEHLGVNQQQPHQSQISFLSSISAIPRFSDKLMSPREGWSPPSALRAEEAGELGQINVHNSASAISQMEVLEISRASVGDFGHNAPNDQEDIAMKGCTFEVTSSAQASGVKSNGGIQQGIRNTARIDVAPHQGAGVPTQDRVLVGSVVVVNHQDNRDQQPNQLYLVEDELEHQEGAIVDVTVRIPHEGEVVVGQDVVVANNGEGGSQNSTAVQAAVQSSRYDEESEQVLFLGGQPVTLSPRSARVLSKTKESKESEGNSRNSHL